MLRTCMLVALASCASQPREVSKLRYTSDTASPCTAGCEAPVITDETERFKPPDEAWDGHQDTVAGVVASRPPEPTCGNVAITLAAFELGNYSDDEARAPVVARHELACARAQLSRDARACLITVTASWQVAYCAPRLVPTARADIAGPGDCAQARSQIRDRLGAYGQTEGAWTGKLDALEASCMQDHWPSEFVRCASMQFSPYAGTELSACQQSAPGWLTDRIQARLAAVPATGH